MHENEKRSRSHLSTAAVAYLSASRTPWRFVKEAFDMYKRSCLSAFIVFIIQPGFKEYLTPSYLIFNQQIYEYYIILNALIYKIQSFILLKASFIFFFF